MRQFAIACLFTATCGLTGLALVPAQDAKKDAMAIAPEEANLGRPVDFAQDVFPILDAKCVACHNVAINENGLNLEDVKSILKGGKRGPSVVAKDPEKSLIYKVATRGTAPAMPPLPNKVEATSLTPKELGVLKQWIIEGATEGMGAAKKVINWHPIPASVQPIYAVSLTPDGQYVAFGRANKVLVYHIPTGEQVGELSDPALLSVQYNGKPMYTPGTTHRDFVHSLAISKDGRTIASGSYREVKLWTRPSLLERFKLEGAGAITRVAVSPNDQFAAMAAADNSIHLVSLADGKIVRTLAGHTAAVSGVKFSADSARLVSSSLDKTVRIWNVADGVLLGRIDTPAAANDATLSVDGTKVAVAQADNLVRVFDVPATPPTTLATLAARVPAIAVSPDRKFLALAEADGKVTLIDLATKQVAKSLAGHQGAVTSVAFSGNSTRLVSGGADKTVRLWDVASGNALRVVSGSLAPVTAVSLNADGNLATSGTGSGQVTLWKFDAADPRVIPADLAAAPTVSAVSPDYKLLAVDGTVDGKPAVLVRDIASGQVVKSLLGHEGAVTAVAFSGDNQRLISGSADKTARVWTLADNKEVAKFAVHGNTVTAVALTPNGQQAVSGAADNSLKLWNTADAAEVANFAGHTGALVSVAVTPNAQAVVSASADETVRTWNLQGQQASAITYGHGVTAFALSPNGALYAVAGADNHVRLYQPDGKQLFDLPLHTAAIKSLSFSPDNTRLLSGGADNVVAATDVATGTLLETRAVPTGLAIAGFGPAANQIVIGAADKSAQVATLYFERSFAGLTQAVSGLAQTAGGDAIFVASVDGTVRRFVTGNAQQAWVQNHGAAVHDVALSVDNQWLATAGANNQVRVWNAGNGGNGPKPDLAGFTGPVLSVAFTPDNQNVISGTADNQVWIHRLKDGVVLQNFFEHTGAVDGIVVTGETGKSVITTSADKTVRTFSFAAGVQLAGHGGPVNSVAYVLPQGAQIVTGSDDGTARVWDANNGNVIRPLGHGGPVTGVAVRPDGQFIATVGANNIARLWNAGNGQAVVEIKGDARALALVATLTLDETEAKANTTATMAAIAPAEKNSMEKAEAVTKATEAKTKAETAFTEATAKAKTAAEAAAVAKKAFADKADDAALKKASEDATKAETEATAAAQKAEGEKNSAVAALTQAEKQAKEAAEAIVTAKAAAAAAATAQTVAEMALANAKTAVTGTEKPFRSVSFARDGKLFAIAGDGGTVSTYDGTTGAPFEVYDASTAPVSSIALGASGILITGSADLTGKIWSLNAPFTLAAVLGPKADAPQDVSESQFVDRVLCLDFSPDGKLLATGGGDPSRSGEVMIWDIATKSLVKSLPDAHSDTVLGIEFSRDGTQLLTGAADKFVKIFDVATGGKVKAFEGHTNHVLDVSWKADSKVISSAGADNVIKVWNVETGEQTRTIQGFTKQVTSIAFMGRGNNMISCSGDKTVRFHQADNGNNFRNFGGSTDFMFASAGSDNELIVVAGGQDGNLRIWNGANAQVLKTFEAPKPEAPANQTAGK